MISRSSARDEAVAVLRWSDAEPLHKRAPETVRIAKAHGISDVFNCLVGRGKPLSCLIEP